MKQPSRQSGFTFLEVMAAIVVISVMSLTSTMVLLGYLPFRTLATGSRLEASKATMVGILLAMCALAAVS